MRRDVAFLARLTGLTALGWVSLATPVVAQPQPPTDGGEPAEPAPEAPPEVTPTPAPAPVVEPAPAPAPPPQPQFVPPSDEPPPPPPPRPDLGFKFGSYGRVSAGSDLRGGKPVSVNVVGRGPRIVERNYLEFDLMYGFETPRGMVVRPVVTLAFDGTLFHDTGVFDARPALRNMFLTAQVTKHVNAWAGSRMYRGDDIYLFDYWPLDDQNTVGGGLQYRKSKNPDGSGDAVELAVHAGVNRLLDPFQFQEIDVPDPEQGATTVLQLDRQRMVASTTGAYIVGGMPGQLGFKFKAHGEVHALPAGTRKREDGTFEALPADSGWLAGVQATVYGWSRNPAHRNHLNLYMRYAHGLAAFDELAPPRSFGPELTTERANEFSFGASGVWDHALGNVMLGALSRRFIDADANTTDPDDGWEYAIDIRPLAKIVPDVFAGVDLSYQARFPSGLNPVTLRAEDPAVFQIAPMIVYSPLGPSAYDRPQLRLVYRAAHQNEGARNLYVPDDPRQRREWVHFLGVQAEWWFNSASLIR